MKLFVENLTHVDFSYIDPRRGLLGESWAVNLTLDGSLDEQGMICDFSTVKKRVKQWLDSSIDHCLVVARGLDRLEYQRREGTTALSWYYPDGKKLSCSAPDQAIALVDLERIDERALAEWCCEQLLALFPEQVSGVGLEFVPERIDGAYYHYSHGLQQHGGNCQRIAHGHRSRIQVLRNGRRDPDIEAQWAGTLRDIYIGSLDHLTRNGDTHLYIYDAPQGHFELSLPAEVCYDIDTESTVERIAEHLAQRIKAGYPQDRIEVRAFEGIGKGAVAEA